MSWNSYSMCRQHNFRQRGDNFGALHSSELAQEARVGCPKIGFESQLDTQNI